MIPLAVVLVLIVIYVINRFSPQILWFLAFPIYFVIRIIEKRFKNIDIFSLIAYFIVQYLFITKIANVYLFTDLYIKVIGGIHIWGGAYYAIFKLAIPFIKRISRNVISKINSISFRNK